MSRPIYEDRRYDRAEKKERRRKRRDKLARRRFEREAGTLAFR